MTLFGCTQKLICQTKNGENVLRFELIEVVFVQCQSVDDQYQQKSEVLNSYLLINLMLFFLNTEPSNLVFLKIYNTENNNW